MKFTKISIILTFVLSFALNGLAQIKNNLSYPNELRGFGLMKNSKLKVLIPGVSTEEDEKKIFREECRNLQKRIAACELDKDWYVSFSYLDDALYSMRFYPRKRIPFSKI